MSRRGLLALLALLAGLAVWPYAGAGAFGFAYDDKGYLLENPVVRSGLTLAGVRWAFTSFAMANWHPATWLSHMADVSLFGLDAGRHHLVNVALHAGNSLLVFAALRSLTGALWRPLAVAALFAAHPVHVESVAWISERKDVLSASWFLLALLAQRWYLRRRGRARRALLAGCFIVALLAKPMVVTLPLVLLLLDFWPLGRSREGWPSLVREKLPLLLAAAAVGGATFAAQSLSGAVSPLRLYPWAARLANAAASYALYLRNVLWPHALSVFYPHPGPTPAAGTPLLGLLALAGATAAALALRRRAPYLLAGWAWFVAMLLPVIGIVQLGSQAMADRYLYLPLVGIAVAAVWGATALAPSRRAAAGTALAALVVVAALAAAARTQTAYWKDDLTLFSRAVALDPGNSLARSNLGYDLIGQGRNEEAIVQLSEAVRERPEFYEALHNLGIALTNVGRVGEALPLLLRAVAVRPRAPEAYESLGMAYVSLGDRERALAVCAALRALDPARAARLLRFASALPPGPG